MHKKELILLLAILTQSTSKAFDAAKVPGIIVETLPKYLEFQQNLEIAKEALSFTVPANISAKVPKGKKVPVFQVYSKCGLNKNITGGYVDACKAIGCYNNPLLCSGLAVADLKTALIPIQQLLGKDGIAQSMLNKLGENAPHVKDVGNQVDAIIKFFDELLKILPHTPQK